MILHGKFEAVGEDVVRIGKAIGVKYQGDVMNRFNVLSKEGRCQLQEVVGSKADGGEVSGAGVDGC